MWPTHVPPAGITGERRFDSAEQRLRRPSAFPSATLTRDLPASECRAGVSFLASGLRPLQPPPHGESAHPANRPSQAGLCGSQLILLIAESAHVRQVQDSILEQQAWGVAARAPA